MAQGDQKLKDVTIEGQTYEVPSDWSSDQIGGYVKAYQSKTNAPRTPPKAASKTTDADSERRRATVGVRDLPSVKEQKATLSALPKPSLLERGKAAIKETFFPEVPGRPSPIKAATTPLEYEKWEKFRETPLLPEGIVSEAVAAGVKVLSTGGGLGRSHEASPAQAMQQAHLAVELHRQGLDKDPHPEKWIQNAVRASVLDLGEVGDEVARGLTTPDNIALLAGMAALPEEGGPAVLAKLTAAGFSLAQARQAADAINRSYQLHLKGDDVAAGKELADATVQAAFAILAGIGAVKGPKKALKGEKEGAKPSTTEGEELPPLPARATSVPQETIDTASFHAGVTPEGPPVKGDSSIHAFRDPQTGGSLYLKQEEMAGKSPEELSSLLRKKAEEKRELIGPPKPDEDQALKSRRASAQARHEEFQKSYQASSEQNIAPPEDQPGPDVPPPKAKVTPERETIGTLLKDAWQEIKATVAPASMDAYAKASGLRLRRAAAEIAARDERANDLFSEYRAMFDREYRKDQLAFMKWIDAYERTGDASFAEPKHQELAEKWQDIQTRTWNEVRKREGMERFIDNYFPHLFEDEKTASQIFSKRPLQGPRSWRYKREFPTMKEAIDFARENGFELKPLFDNPVDYMQAKLHEMNKYVVMHDFAQEMKELGIWKFKFGPISRMPGMVVVEDPLGTVWGPSRFTQTLRAAHDEILFNQLNDFARSLGIQHVRKVKLRGGEGVWGYTMKNMRIPGVWTKFAGPEEVLTHEMGHQLHFRYPELDALIKDPNTKEELRKLADLRYEGRQEGEVSDYFKKYTRKGTEKIANLIHAYVHMRERGRQIAPNTFARVDHIIQQHPELRPLEDIHPGLMLGVEESKQNIQLPGRTEIGHYYAPEGAARIVNNYLKPGIQDKALYKLFRYPNNILNQVQLGALSGFHFTFTGMDSAVSMFSLGMQEIGRGEVLKGLGHVARGNLVVAPIETYIRGSKALKEFYGTPQGDFYRQTVNRLIEAGGRVKMENFYHNSSVEDFLKAWRQGRPLQAAKHSLPAFVEALARPIMSHWVPRMKLGVFSMLADEEMSRLGPNASLWEQRGALARAWDSVDNRLGQMVYDNTFWAKTHKDLAMLAVRSLGWTVGTFREIGGGTVELVKLPFRGKKAEVTPRMAYTVALPIVIAMHGAMIQYLLTGKGPQEVFDFFYPRTGKNNSDGTPERLAIPSYAKDEFSYLGGFRLGAERGAAQFGQTLEHKASPELSMILETLRNRDFYNTKIRNEDDPFVIRLRDQMEYMIAQAEPFWLRNVERRKQSEGDLNAKAVVESLFGFLPASRAATSSPAVALALEYMAEKVPAGARTKEQAEAAKERGVLVQQFRARNPDAMKNLAEAVKSGKLSRKDYKAILHAGRMTPLQQTVEHLSLSQTLSVWERATEEERKQLFPLLRKKIPQVNQEPPEARQRLRERLDKALGRNVPVPEEFPEVPDREEQEETSVP